MAEYLLRVIIKDNDQFSFFNRYQAGFVVSARREPAFSLCGCSNPHNTCRALNTLKPVNTTAQCPHLATCEECLDSDLFTVSPISNSSGSCPATLPGCYTVDRASVNITRSLTCHESSHMACGSPEERPIGATFPDQSEQLAVTVWYNNQVKDISSVSVQ